MSKFIVKVFNLLSEEEYTDNTWFHSEEDAQNYIDNELYPALSTGAEIFELRGEDFTPSEYLDCFVEEVDDDEYLDLEEDPNFGFEPDDNLRETWRMHSLPQVLDDEENWYRCDECGAGIRWDDGKMVCQSCHKIFNSRSIRKCPK